MENSLPSSWAHSKIDECFYDLINGTTIAQNESDGLTVTRIETIQNSKFDLSRVKFIKDAEEPIVEKFRYRIGDIAFSHINSMEHVGKVALYEGYPEILIHGMNLLRLRLGHTYISPKYAYYYFLTIKFREDVRQRVGQAVNQVSINQKNLKEVPFVLCPLPEQQRIVAKLDALTEKIECSRSRLQKIPNILKRFRQSILSAAVSGKLTEEWRERNFQSDEDNTIADLPFSWSWKSVRELAKNERGAIQSGPFGSNLLHSEFQKQGILAIGIDNVLDGKFSLGKQHRISKIKYDELKKFTAKPLDVLVTVMATVGRCCVLPANIEKAIITKHVYRISCDSVIVNPHFLLHSLRSSIVEEQVQKEIRGATRPGINGAILKNLMIPLPSISEQNEIVRKVAELLSVADKIEARYLKAKAQFDKLPQSLLAKAFRGELVAQDPNDEPASVLLERIKGERQAIQKEMVRSRSKHIVK